MTLCYPCIRGLHEACRGEEYCNCNHVIAEATEKEEPTDTEPKTHIRSQKPDDALVDQQSTGRKRAARMYPLDRDEPCEWLGKTNMGGGTKPIDGCPVKDNCKQLARHHGPDKNTLNNEEGNVHRIGHLCHNRWHAANDPDYQPGMLLAD